MCLAVPGKIVEATEIDGIRVGRVAFGGIVRDTYLDFVPDAGPGDYVLVHVGLAISKIDEAVAARTMALLEQIGALGEELGVTPEALEAGSG